MAYGLILVLHVIVCLLLIAVILVQGGRGGMAETLGGSGSQSLFGGGANIVMTKVTAIGAGIFMLTCISLALLSTQRGRSVIERTQLAPSSGAAGLLPPPIETAEEHAAHAGPEAPLELPAEPVSPPVP